MKESAIQKKIIEYIKNINGDCFKITATSRRGCPDLIALVSGRMILIEVKKEGKQLDSLQKYFFDIWNYKKLNCIKVSSIRDLESGLIDMGIYRV